MKLDEYQRLAREVSTHSLDNPRRVNLEYGALALCGEAGELANLVKKNWRSVGDVGVEIEDFRYLRQEMIDELGDVLWYAAFVADRLGVSLDLVAERNIRKLEDRNAAASA